MNSRNNLFNNAALSPGSPFPFLSAPASGSSTSPFPAASLPSVTVDVSASRVDASISCTSHTSHNSYTCH
ncbi:hypothetical protein CerSpe_075750 [Prunus speciosa]